MSKYGIVVLSLVCGLWVAACPNPGATNQTTDPTPRNWRSYLSSPSIDGTKALAAVSGGKTLVSLQSSNPFPEWTPVVLIGTPPAMIPPSANTPYLIHGYNQTTFSLTVPGSGATISNIIAKSNDVSNQYFIYALDWTLKATSTISQSAGVFSLSAHGLVKGDSVYLDGNAGNAKPGGAYVVTGVPNTNSFTLSGPASGAGDVYRFLAKINQSSGAQSF